MKKNIDIRIIKTKKTINNVFFELMDEVGFSKINVKKIIERAEINRSTFYAHYYDKFDLLEEIETDLLTGLKSIESKALSDLILTNFITETFKSYIQQVAYYMKEHGKIITLLLSDKGDPAFVNKLSEMIKSIWFEKKLIDKFTIPQSYAIAAIIGILTNLLAEWSKSDFRETPEEFALITFKIIKSLPEGILS